MVRWYLSRSPRQLLLPSVSLKVRESEGEPDWRLTKTRYGTVLSIRWKRSPVAVEASTSQPRSSQGLTLANGAVGAAWKSSGKEGGAWMPQNLPMDVQIVSFRTLPQASHRSWKTEAAPDTHLLKSFLRIFVHSTRKNSRQIRQNQMDMDRRRPLATRRTATTTP